MNAVSAFGDVEDSWDVHYRKLLLYCGKKKLIALQVVYFNPFCRMSQKTRPPATSGALLFRRITGGAFSVNRIKRRLSIRQP